MQSEYPSSTSTQDPPVITCHDVSKVFASSDTVERQVLSQQLDKTQALEQHEAVLAVSNATFSVQRGEIFCIMGLSGSGKSTLVRHINRLIEPSAGKVLINGIDIGSLAAPELRALRAEQIGMVFQNMALLPHRDVRDNVAFGLELRDVPIEQRRKLSEEALSRVQLDGWGDRYPDELSGGMRQRVGLARALCADPQILLMDEPFSALDPLIRRQLQDQFLALSSTMNKTTVFITHDLDEAIRLGDRIAIMKDGVLVQIGTPEEIVLDPVDSYVEDFVEGISKLGLISAGNIMSPLREDVDRQLSPRVSHDTPVRKLIEICVDSEHDVTIVDGHDAPIGQVDVRSLLSAIKDLN